MKRRVIALMGAVLLVASMSMTAMAAPSVSAEVSGIVSATDTKGAVDVEGADAKIVVTELGASQPEAVPAIKETATLKEVLGNKFETGMQVADLKEVKVVGDGEVTFPVTITFKVNGVKAGDEVYVLHYTGTAWENLGGTAGDGTITAKFNSLSPVAFVVKATSTSPKTGTPVMMAVAAVALGAAGLAASKKRA